MTFHDFSLFMRSWQNGISLGEYIMVKEKDLTAADVCSIMQLKNHVAGFSRELIPVPF